MDQNIIGQNRKKEDSWRMFRIMAEFVEGFETLSEAGPCVTIFGSARTEENDDYYKMAYETSRLAAENGFGVISGGGPGIMEAANRGAMDADGKSIGLNIRLPYEQMPNKYIKQLINFQHFFCRKVMFLKYTSAVIIMPGGYGTLDEMFETMTLIQTQKISHLPLILMGKDYWAGMVEWLNKTMLGNKYIDKGDLDIMKMTDDSQETINIINTFYKKRKSNINFV